MAKEQPNLLSFLDSATEDDLEAVQQRIGETENELAALRAAEKILSLKLHGKPEKKPRAPKKSDETNSVRRQMAEYLRLNGPKKPATIAAALGIGVMQIVGSANHSMFRRNPDGQIELVDL